MQHFFIGKLPHQTLIKRVVFDDWSKFWNPQSLPRQRSKHTATHPAQQVLGGHLTSRNQGLSSNYHGRQTRESLGARLLEPWSLFSVFTWRHGGRVGVQNNSEKSLLGIWFCYCEKLEQHFAIVFYTTWLSHHVNENQELPSECLYIPVKIRLCRVDFWDKNCSWQRKDQWLWRVSSLSHLWDQIASKTHCSQTSIK